MNGKTNTTEKTLATQLRLEPSMESLGLWACQSPIASLVLLNMDGRYSERLPHDPPLPHTNWHARDGSDAAPVYAVQAHEPLVCERWGDAVHRVQD